MMQQLSDLQFLKYFISDALYPRYDQENEVLKDFYSQHWGRFTELSVKADKILNQEELIKLYVVVLYLKCSIKLKAKTYSIFIEAYRCYLNEFKSVLHNSDVIEPLFIYGFDQFNPFAQGHPFEQYEKLKKQYTRIESYTSIRGHLKKMDFFKEQQAYAEYALQCLEHMNQYDFYYKDYGLIDLKIWAMALLVLFNQQYQASFLVQLLQQNYAMFDADAFRILTLYCEKMLQQYGEEIFIEEARPYVKQLIEMENVKRRASETFGWKTELGLDLPLADWLVSLWIELRNEGGYLHIELQDDAQFNWSVYFYDRQLDRTHRESFFYMSTNPNSVLDIPYFADYGLIQLPVWLKALQQQGYDFDLENIKITGLKKKADKQKVIQWLVSPFKH